MGKVEVGGVLSTSSRNLYRYGPMPLRGAAMPVTSVWKAKLKVTDLGLKGAALEF